MLANRHKKKWMGLFALLMVGSLILSACATPTPEEKIVTQVVKETVKETVIVEGTPKVVEKEVTKIVEVEKVVTPTPAPAPAKPKVLTIGMRQEPRGFGPNVAQSAASQVAETLNAKLIHRNPEGEMDLWLAVSRPSLEDGTWVINPDGTMDCTWKIRQGVKWHDGQELTVEDFKFAWQVYSDPEIPIPEPYAANLVEDIEIVDPYTMIVHWKRTYFVADESIGGQGYGERPLPKHILYDVWQSDKDAFLKHEHWTKSLTGTGPYKFKEWVPGSHIVLEANPDYFLGKPKIDTVVWKFIPDTNTLVANVMAGAVDMTVLPGIDLNQGLTIKEIWDETGDGEVRILQGYYWDWIVFNVTDRGKVPYMVDKRLRQALMYAMDRQQIVDAVYQGENTLADVAWYAPYKPIMQGNEEAYEVMKTYEYDPDKARALLEEAGFTDEDGDGVRECHGCLYAEEGTKLSMNYRTITGDKNKEDVEALITQYWAEVGVETVIDNVPPAIMYAPDHLWGFGYPGALQFNFGGSPAASPPALDCADIPSEENGWRGSNLAGWCNEEWESGNFKERFEAAFEWEEQQHIIAEIVALISEEVPFMPLYFKNEPCPIRKGVKVPPLNGSNEGWMYQIHLWDIEE